jgi:hypothetical protein
MLEESMSWLKDIEDKWRKKRAETASKWESREKRRELYQHLFSAKYKSVDGVVTRLLNDLGKAYWGARKYGFERSRSSWKIYLGLSFWQVNMSANPREEDFIAAPNDKLDFSFYVMSKRPANISDISEDTLKAALRAAAEAGPDEQEIDG